MSAYVASRGQPMKYPTEVAQRRQQVRALSRMGHSAADIARRLGVSDRTVKRYRATTSKGTS